MSIYHTKTTEIFSKNPAMYSLCRPHYPLAMIQDLKAKAGSGIVADIGCGTGILTKQLLEAKMRVIGVEPNKAMYNQAQIDLEKYNCQLVNAPAEDTTLEENSIKLITVAQALHWFDFESFRIESERILVRGGLIASIYNNMEKGTRIVDDFLEIHRKLCSNYRGGYNRMEALYDKLFAEGYEIREYPNNQTYNLEHLLGYTSTLSYCPSLLDPNYIEYIKSIYNFFKQYSYNDEVTIPMTTTLAIGSLK